MTEQKKTGMMNGGQMRITEQDKAIIAANFKENPNLIYILRKMFLPELDPTVAIGQMIDLYATIKTQDRTPEDIAVDLQARNMLIGHVDNVLMQLDLISKQEATTPEEANIKIKANSAK